jgi:hypothetical protein
MRELRDTAKTIIREIYLIIPVLFYLFLSLIHKHIVFINFFLASAVISALCIIKRKDILAIMDDKIEPFKNTKRKYARVHITTSLFILFATLLNTFVTSIASFYYTYAIAAKTGTSLFLPIVVFDTVLLFYSLYGLVLIPKHMRSALIFLRETRNKK